MSESTDAKLWFGVCWTDNDEKYYESGLPKPVQAFLQAQYGLESNEDEDDDGGVVFQDKMVALVEKLIKPFEVELIRHCHGDSIMYALGIQESEQRARRGKPLPLDLGSLTRAAEYRPLAADDYGNRIHHACIAVGWPIAAPTWWLASYWC